MFASRRSASLTRVVRRWATTLALTLAATATFAFAPLPARADEGTALALGDSVAFGYIEQAGYAYVNPNNFVGYPYYVGWELGLSMTNAACPGETTGSFIFATSVESECRQFRSNFPLHVPYKSTQLRFAIAFLQSHRQTRLVTVGLGANDVLDLRASCAGDIACIEAGLPKVLASISGTLDKILEAMRATGFRGVLMLANYYSLDYTDPLETGVTIALNDTLAAVARSHGAVVADVFSAFQTAASTPFAGGMTCRAGLLNVDVQDQSLCDVHPSQSGQQLIADTIESTYRNALRHDQNN